MIQSGAHWAIVTATVGNISPQSGLTADQIYLCLLSLFTLLLVLPLKMCSRRYASFNRHDVIEKHQSLFSIY